MSSIVLFIPRILPNVSKKMIMDRFLEEKIGKITHIQSKYRKNERNYDYWFAFITIEIFDTVNGNIFWKEVVENKITIALEYQDPSNVKTDLYWEVHLCKKNNPQHFVLETTEKKTVVLETRLQKYELEEGEIRESPITTREHLEMYQDYLVLERDIFGNNYLCKV